MSKLWVSYHFENDAVSGIGECILSKAPFTDICSVEQLNTVRDLVRQSTGHKAIVIINWKALLF